VKIFFLPSKSKRRLKELPSEAGIYYMTAFWVVFYVGKSKNIRSRWRKHHKYNQFEILGIFGRVHYKIMPESQLHTYEKNEITRLNPPWNYSKTLGFWGLIALFMSIWGRVIYYIIITALIISFGVYLIWFF